MRPNPLLAVLLAASAVAGCATGGPDVLGRNVTLVPKEPESPKARGELLAVQDGRLWLRRKDQGVRECAAASLREVKLQRRGFGGGSTRQIGLIGGVLSTVALSASCASVEGNGGGGCLAIGGVVGGIFALTGVLSSKSLDASARAYVAPQDVSLRGYARFPAGLPKDVPPDWLARPPDRSK